MILKPRLVSSNSRIQQFTQEIFLHYADYFQHKFCSMVSLCALIHGRLAVEISLGCELVGDYVILNFIVLDGKKGWMFGCFVSSIFLFKFCLK